MKILIVDDEKAIRKVFKMVLAVELPACQVDLAVNGAEAVDAFRKGFHDVLFLDLNMPVKDGYTAFLEIKEICKKKKRKVPFIIFCTGYEVPKELEYTETEPVNYCILRKPVTPDNLIETLQARAGSLS
ncbi:MAG: response regulator [Kiritimatiellae bacterium]|nr:response regulator [Kiritimatiellia bacterium]MDD5521684.1 response regulator [Kiritimatiellia bacterium]